MFGNTLLLRCALAIAGFLVGAAIARADAPSVIGSPEVRVSTLSGSGAAGIADGSARTARYIAPFGLAADRNGRLYVSDAGAQRIRVIERDGTIRTLAGSGAALPNGLWVAGGYADGRGSQARFNRPAGLASGADGALYVADTNNHCIRRIDSSGNVTTFAGSPVAGHADGPRISATFDRPTGMASDAAGNLYVADFFGIRVISRDGIVSTIPNFGSTPFGISVVATSRGPVIFIADLLGIARRMPDGTVERFAAPEGQTGNRNLQGGAALGYPFGIAAFDENSVVFSDVRSNTVNYLNWAAGALQTLAGAPTSDGAASTGGYRNGTGAQARFDAPTGVLARTDGSMLVADAANRRVRKISGLDRSHDARPGGEPRVASGGQRIVFVGNSFLWEYTRWSDSIQGMVERALRARSRRNNIVVNPYVFPGAGFGADLEYIELLARAGAANTVIFNINPNTLAGTGGLIEAERDPASWRPLLISTLRRMNRTLESLHVHFFVYTTPLGADLSPFETAWGSLLSSDGQIAPDGRLGNELNSAVKESGVHFLDLWSVFRTYLREPDHQPLFGTSDEHFSYAGRVLVAQEIVKALADSGFIGTK